MSFKHMTPEQRIAAQQKSAATRAANRAAKLADVTPFDDLEVSEPLVLRSTATEDVFDGLLTDEEKAEIVAASRKKAREDHRKAAKAAFAKEQLELARREIGDMPADEEFRKDMGQVVRVYIDMPRMRKPTGGEQDPEPIIIDQTVYSSGRYYDIPKAQAVYVHSLMDQARRHVNQVDGRSRTYYHQGTGQMVYQGGTAMGGGSLGTSFDSLHKRSA